MGLGTLPKTERNKEIAILSQEKKLREIGKIYKISHQRVRMILLAQGIRSKHKRKKEYKECSCGKPVKAKGLCRLHYDSARRTRIAQERFKQENGTQVPVNN